MTRHRIILDCDPGVDDAVAMLLALASPDEIEVVGITTVAGNVSLAHTTRNALRLCALATRPDIPVYAGCERPILPSGRNPGGVHGTDGLGDIGLPDASVAPQARHAVDFIIETVLSAPGAITLCPIGPMTNVALALLKAPAIAPQIKQIVFMGGAAFCPGNSTPEAEFNVWFDPHAAEVVLSAGVPLVMFGLDVTRHARIDAERLQRLGSRPGPVAQAAVGMMQAYGRGDPCLHDACVTAHLIDPTLFEGVEADVSVDLVSPLSLGRTVAAVSDRHRRGRATNCRVITSVDDTRLFDLLDGRLGRFSPTQLS